MSELEAKLGRLRNLLEKQKLKGVLLSRQSNFAWITCGGDNHVVMGSDAGVASVLITRDRTYVVTSNIEAGRIANEELNRDPDVRDAFRVISHPWHREGKKLAIIREICSLKRLGTDTPLRGAMPVDREITPLRYSLTPEEISRYEWVGGECGKSMGKVCRSIKTGSSENQIAGRLAEDLLAKGITPTVLLIAADERISGYRHPIPTDNKVRKYVMVVLCGKKWGLIVSLTRLVHLGRLSRQLRRKHNAVARVDVGFITDTRPGVKVSTVFKRAVRAYKSTGFSNEWRFHHQGGATGYEGRDYKAAADCKEIIRENQAFAWNPSITGTKSEDTIIALPGETKIISVVPGWPLLKVEHRGHELKRPDILVK